jgi:hypothetical protein
MERLVTMPVRVFLFGINLVFPKLNQFGDILDAVAVYHLAKSVFVRLLEQRVLRHPLNDG